MAWPDDTDLPVEVEGAFGADLTADPGTWSWTDLSSRLRAVPIILRAGKSGGAGRVSPGTCSVTLDNDDSALTPLHPLSPYWPNVELGTPIRTRIRRAEDAFARTTSLGWGTADSGQVWTASGADFSTAAGVARHIHSTVNLLRRSTLAVALADSEQMVDVAPSALLTGAALVTGLLFRYQNASNYYWLRCEFNSGGTSVMLKITRCVGGTFTDLATINPLPGVPYAAGGYLRVRASVIGSRLAMKAWNPAGAEPAGWTLTATDSSITAAGATGLQSWLVAGNTNTLPVEARYRSYAARVDRFSGTADQWQPTYLPAGEVGQMSSAVRITASGILRRLQQGTQPSRSALRRTIPATGALAYWPVEDGSDASVASSAIAGHPPITVSGQVTFAPIEEWADTRGYEVKYGTDALADVSAGATLSATVPPDVTTATGTADGWTVAIAADVGSPSALSADLVLIEVHTPGGTYTTWRMVLTTTGRTRIVASNASTTVTVVDDPSMFGEMVPHNMAVWQVGGSVFAGFSWSSVGWEGLGSVAGTVGGVSKIVVNSTGVTSTAAVPLGHIALWAGHELPVVNLRDGNMMLALFGYLWTGIGTGASGPHGEPATTRLARLAAEDGVPLDMPTVAVRDTDMMGWQQPDVALDLYHSCEAVDLGVLAEQGFGLVYMPRAHRYNRPVALTIDLAKYQLTRGSGDPLAPTYDDQDVRNQWTVARTDGSSATAVDVDHQRRGVYSDSVELDFASDAPLSDHASWRVHLGTVVDLREQTFPIDLAANPELLDGWLSCRVGSRIVRTNPPAQHRPGDLDRLVEGWTETIGPRSWQVQVVPAPAEPWDVAVAGGAPRVPARGSTIAGPLTDSAMAFALASTAANGAWTTNPAYFPQYLRVGGEKVTASAIGPALADSFTRTGSNGWGTPDSGPAWTTSGGSASNYSTNGTAGVHTVDSVNVTRESVADVNLAVVDVTVTGVAVSAAPTGAAIHQAVAARYDSANYVELRVFRPTAGAPTVVLRQLVGGVETFNGFPTVAGATNTSVLSMRLQAVGSVLRGKVWITGQPEPEAWLVELTGTLLDAGDVAIRSLRETGNTNAGLTATYDSVAMTNLQTVTLSARSVNGVTRAWPVGTEVDVWTPAIAPL